MGSVSGLWVSSVGIPTATCSYFTCPGVPNALREGGSPGAHCRIPHTPALEGLLGKMVVKLKSSGNRKARSYQCLEAVSADAVTNTNVLPLACPEAGKHAESQSRSLQAQTHGVRAASQATVSYSPVTGLSAAPLSFFQCTLCWSIVNLQRCVGSRYTAKWLSYA